MFSTVFDGVHAQMTLLTSLTRLHDDTTTPHYGDATSFHEWEFRTRLRIAGESGDQYVEAMSKVCVGLRGDAFVAAQEVGFDNPCEVIDGRPMRYRLAD